MQEVAAGVADTGVNALDSGFRLLPVVAEFGFAAHGLLRFAQGRFMPLEAVERRVERAVRECGEADHAHVDTHCCGGLRHGLLNFALGLDAYEPLAARLAHGDISDCAQHLATIAVAQPSQLGQEDTTVALIELDLLRVGVAEAVALAFLLETWKVGPLGEEVAVGPLQILERLLQGMDRRIGQPNRFRAVAPLGEHLAQPGVAQLLLSALVALFLQRQPLVVDEPARAGEAAHLPLLLAVWSQFVFEGLEALHADIIIWPMGDDNDIRHGRHCVFKMHVHLAILPRPERRGLSRTGSNAPFGTRTSLCFLRALFHLTCLQ